MKIRLKSRIMVLFLAIVLTAASLPGTTVQAAKKAVGSVTVKAGSTNVTKKTYSMKIGDKATLKVTTKPAAAAKGTVKYASSDKSVAAVTSKGKVTAKKAGAANITITISGKTYQAVSTWVTIYVEAAREEATEETDSLVIKEQGMFSAGGTVTAPVDGTYDPTQSFMDMTRAGNTAHVDHANVFYQIPEKDNGNPMVYLHGYGQSRMGWMTTPDGREGWSDIFLKNGHSAYLVDQPRRGEAGNTVQASEDTALDLWDNGTGYKPGDQAWYTHFRIGRVAPEVYEGSQFPNDAESVDQFFRQMTPNTGSFDQGLVSDAMAKIVDGVKDETGNKSILVTHSQGGGPGWETVAKTDNVSAIVAIEPGGAPQVDSEAYKVLLEKKIPVVIYFGDYIDNGPEDLMTTGFWKGIRDGAVEFAAAYNAAGGDATVVDLPKEGITGNSHFMFQEKNNDVIAAHIEAWLNAHGLD